jgi:FAD/FMN-containing dehydrogenase
MESVSNIKSPDSFPANIPISRQAYSNWDGSITASAVWTCTPQNADDVVAACNWAAQNGFTVRPKGIAHNWSPLTIAAKQPDYNKILLVDTTVSLNSIQMIPATDSSGPAVKVGTGATLGQLMEFLEKQPGGKGTAPGFSFPHIPAPGHLSIGGMLAINAHGSAIPTPPLDHFATTYGSMSNRILSLTAVITDPTSANPNQYGLKTFLRGDHETTAFLTQLGRVMIVEVTLQVIDNFNLRCQSITNLDKKVLFANQQGITPPLHSCADFLSKSGRIEIIWFPYTDNPWLKVWTVEPIQPSGSKLVTEPNNYTFSDNLPEWVTKFIEDITRIPGLTVEFGKIMEKISSLGLDLTETRDLWGPSKNTMIYIKDTTLRVTANGYAVLMNRDNVQQAIADVTTEFEALLAKYQKKGFFGEYPVNGPMEIRVTGLDRPDEVPSMTGGPAGRPVISSLSADAETEKNNWDVAVWFDVLTIPGTPNSNDFYAELEAWIISHFQAPAAKVVPEWSKGWAYTSADGAWTSGAFMGKVREGFTQYREPDDNWDWELATLAKYDAQNLFFSPLNQQLFVPAGSSLA